jgi:uncharacterized membrane protein YesL
MENNMSNLFNMDNPVFTAIGKICDLFLLSVVWILLCLPLITIGPANTAIYYATVKVIRKDRGYLMREFFKSFKLNFKKGAIIGIILTLASVILAFDIYWAKANMSNMPKYGSILFGVFIALAFFVVCIIIYAFPILSRFDMTIKQLIKASAFMAAKHFPSSLVMLLINAVCIVAGIWFQILILILPALDVLLISFVMERILKKYTPKSEGTPEETGKDEWYLE